MIDYPRMNIMRFLSCALPLCCSLTASEIWTYTGPVMTYVSGDPSLRPPGLGDHFVITITLGQPSPRNALYTVNPVNDAWNTPSPPSISWRDGTVEFGLAGPYLGIDEIGKDAEGKPFVGFLGVGGFGARETWAFVGVGMGADAIEVCNGDPTVSCVGGSYDERASVATGTWTVTETPEPHALFMIPSGLLAMWAIPRARQMVSMQSAALIRKFR